MSPLRVLRRSVRFSPPAPAARASRWTRSSASRAWGGALAGYGAEGTAADFREAANLPPGMMLPSGTELAREMPGMIITQRTYEANAQTVRTADEMLGTLLNLKA